ncbi:HalX domain-containing protein [Halorarius litoreus]|uniref:HalX domain-containing protein n=1 Tax=Halorarius litoreus TaxID=2962676 RepID=UPI0020CF9102|nr:HalX domain-containing protein [Halorarius litoreus]
MSDGRPTVLVIDDEPDLADLYAAWLTSEYDVRTAYGGGAALEEIDEEVSVALIDRLMPDLSGDEVLERIREEGYDCRVAMVTAVEPDFDIIDMGFDDYLVKPVRREELQGVVESLLKRTTYDAQLREYFSMVSKRAALESQKSDRELAESEAYASLTEDIEALSAQLDETTASLDAADFEVALRNLDDA